MSDSPGLYSSNLEPYIVRALQAILGGQPARTEDLEHVSGEVHACLKAMQEALLDDGPQAALKVFTSLIGDRPWLARLASLPSPDAQLPELPARRVRFLDDQEFENRPPRIWLIPNILPKEGVALVFGPSGCGKSFLVIAWSLCIATGTPWLGREVHQGPVAYIAGEGAFGIGPRLKAWKHYHGLDGNSGVKWFDESLVLHDSGSFGQLLQAFERDFAQPPVMVVIDTLSRCSGGADENSNTDMARVIAAADALQQGFHCTVLIVHHAGKDSERGPRGASALATNTETIVEVARTEQGCRLTCFKQKDAPRFESFSLRFHLVQYGPGEHDSSAILLPDAANSQPILRPSESVMLAVLEKAGRPLTFTEWKQAGMQAGLKERTVDRAIGNLAKGDAVQRQGKQYVIAEQGEGMEDLWEQEDVG